MFVGFIASRYSFLPHTFVVLVSAREREREDRAVSRPLPRGSGDGGATFRGLGSSEWVGLISWI